MVSEPKENWSRIGATQPRCEMGRNKTAGPKGAIVGSGGATPLFGASPAYNTSPYGSPTPYIGPPAYSPSAPPLYSAPGYADQEAGPPEQKPRIKQNRKCRDIAFLILFLAYGIGIIVESSWGFNKGDPRRLVYGLDYKGNTCGDKKGSLNLKSFDIRYWVNPNQVYKSGLASDPFTLTDARSICLSDCPTPSATNLTWVCDYPEGSVALSMSEWAARNYDYFGILSPAQQTSSLNLTGPCYPVLFASTNGQDLWIRFLCSHIACFRFHGSCLSCVRLGCLNCVFMELGMCEFRILAYVFMGLVLCRVKVLIWVLWIVWGCFSVLELSTGRGSGECYFGALAERWWRGSELG